MIDVSVAEFRLSITGSHSINSSVTRWTSLACAMECHSFRVYGVYDQWVVSANGGSPHASILEG
jgi:hypothetical protein